ncbi:MAG: HAD family hydrolase [Gammaproteobacteria bacterium]|nr:MAG: HAD family hydrolase [Gammaproteobacteria bacterium]
MPLRALLFDVDGTLAETERYGHLAAYNRCFREIGLDWEWSAALYADLLAVAGTKERVMYYIDRYQAGTGSYTDMDIFLPLLHRMKNAFFAEIVKSGKIPLRPGVRRLIDEARSKGTTLAITTTTSYENVTALLECCIAPDAVSWFDVIAAGDVVSHKKPAPDIYLYALEQLGLKASECLAIEDSENGVRSARASNVPVLVTVSEYSQGHDFTGAQLVVDSLGEPDQPIAVLEGSINSASYINMDAIHQLASH